MELGILIAIIAFTILLVSIIIFRKVLNPVKLSKVKALMDNRDYEQAIYLLKKLIDKDDDNPHFHYYLGKCYYEVGSQNLAKSEFNQLFRYRLENYNISEEDVRYKLADIYLGNQQNEEALKELLLIYKKNPTDINTCIRIADIFKNKSKWDNALKFYQKALKIDKDNHVAIYSLGEVMYHKKQYNYANKYLSVAVRKAPNSPDAQYFYGLTCKEVGNSKSAIMALSKVVDNKNFGLSANFNLGNIFFKREDYASSIKSFTKALDFETDFKSKRALNILYMLAEAYNKDNQFNKAIENWEKIYKIKKNFRDVVIKLSKYQHLKNDDEVKDLLTASNKKYLEITKKIIHYYECKIVKIDMRKGGKVVDAQTVGSSSGWKKIGKLPVYFYFNRDISIPISRKIADEVLNKMKMSKSAKAFIVVPSFALPEVEELAKQRPLEIINREKLHNVLIELNK